MKKLLLFFMLVFLISSVSALCTVTLDKESYIATETVTAEIVCTSPTQKSDPYNLNWTNQSGFQFELDTGTTPPITGQTFYESYILPSDWPAGTFVNATIMEASLDSATDSANVTAVAEATNSLLITNSTFGGGYMGLVSSIFATIKDENNKKISGGKCIVSIWSNDETQMINSQETFIANGEVKVSSITSQERTKENTQYAYKIICYCGVAGGATECIDEEGNNINNSVGSTKGFLETNQWITWNEDPFPITDKDDNTLSLPTLKAGEDFVYWRRNASSSSSEQLGAKVRTYLVHNTTSAVYGIENEGSTFVGERTFEVGNESRNFNHFLSSNAIDGIYKIRLFFDIFYKGKTVTQYIVDTETFIISGGKIHLDAIWGQMSRTTYQAKVNLTNKDLGVRDVEIKLNNFITDQQTPLTRISNYTVKYWNGSAIPYNTSLGVENGLFDNLKQSFAVVNIQDVNTTLDDTFNVTIELVDWDERQTEALEGIENKTGTFHLDVDCPSSGTIGSNLACIISAYVEDSQTVQKEVDFTCHISDGVSTYSSINFNQMVTKTPIAISQNFLIPSTFSSETQYVLQCYADYYNLGSRRDSFYDTFTASTTSGGSSSRETESSDDGDDENETGTAPITGGIIGVDKDLEGEFYNPFTPKGKRVYTFLAIILLLLATLIFVTSKIKTKCNHKIHPVKPRHYQLNLFKKIAGISLFILVLLFVALGIYAFGSNLINTSQPLQESIVKDPLFRTIVLSTFIIVSIIILFKLLNIKAEIKIGYKDPIEKYWKHRPKD